MAYLKPQSPIKLGEDHIYPLTTIDQIIMNDGQRLSGIGIVLEKPDDFEEDSVTGINADSLGGKSADQYLTTEEMDAQFIKANLEDAIFGEVAMSRANLADRAHLADQATEANKAIEAISANNASKLENKTINELFAMMFEVEHPVGSLYLSASDTDNPNTKWSIYGITCAWELVKDVFLLGAGGNYELGVIGGEAEHTLTVDEMPSHNHTIQHNNDDYNSSSGGGAYGFSTDGTTAWVYTSTVILPTGGNQPHNNMPPYLATNIWKRIS